MPSQVTVPDPFSDFSVATGSADGRGSVRQTSTVVGLVVDGERTWICSGLPCGLGKSSGRGTLSRVGPIAATTGRGGVVSTLKGRGRRIDRPCRRSAISKW